MKVVIEIDDYILDTEIDSDWVSVCNDELAESLINAIPLSDVLQEIRQEIEVQKKGFPPSADYYKAINRSLDIIDKHIKEIEGSDKE